MQDLTWDEDFHDALERAAKAGDWDWARSPHTEVARRLLADIEESQECPTTPPTIP